MNMRITLPHTTFRYLLALVGTFGAFLLLPTSAGAAPPHTTDTNCTSCHFTATGKDAKAHLSSASDCVFCHEGIVSAGNYVISTLDDNETCLFCHTEQNPAFQALAAHGDLSCTRCHDAHGTSAGPRLRSTEIALCSNACHGSGELGRSHPVGPGVIDNLTGAEMTCVSSCHSVHNPAEPKLLQTESQALCKRCHSEMF